MHNDFCTTPSYLRNIFLVEDCKFSLFIPYLDYDRKGKHVHSGIKQPIWKYTAESKIFFSLFFSNGRLLEAGILPRIVNKITIFSVKIGGWAFITAWAFNRNFTVSI